MNLNGSSTFFFVKLHIATRFVLGSLCANEARVGHNGG